MSGRSNCNTSLTNEASRQKPDKRARNDEQNETKRRKIEQGEEIDTPIYATHFSQEDIENEQRRPKKKAAVMIGYSGTGYHGMQMYGYLPYASLLFRTEN